MRTKAQRLTDRLHTSGRVNSTWSMFNALRDQGWDATDFALEFYSPTIKRAISMGFKMPKKKTAAHGDMGKCEACNRPATRKIGLVKPMFVCAWCWGRIHSADPFKFRTMHIGDAARDFFGVARK